jgi:tellurite resistance protein
LEQGENTTDFPPEIAPAQRARLALAVALFDRNHDGKLDAEERKALIDFLRDRLR